MKPDFPGVAGIRMDLAEHLRQVRAADLRGEFKEESDLIDAWLKKPLSSSVSALPPFAVTGNTRSS